MQKDLSFINLFFKIFNNNRIFLLFFFIFLIIYFFDFDHYNTTFATDYQVRYRPNGLAITSQIMNMDFSSNFGLFGGENHHAFINSYFIPEIITGILLRLSPNEYFFSITSNLLNMVLLFLSIYIFFNLLDINNKNKT